MWHGTIHATEHKIHSFFRNRVPADNRSCIEAPTAVRIVPGGEADEADALFSRNRIPKADQGAETLTQQTIQKADQGPSAHTTAEKATIPPLNKPGKFSIRLICPADERSV